MEKIKEIKANNSSGDEMGEKINEIVKVVNGFYEDLEVLEGPIYEKIAPDECLIIAKSREGLLVARNEEGNVYLERVHRAESKKEKEG